LRKFKNILRKNRKNELEKFIFAINNAAANIGLAKAGFRNWLKNFNSMNIRMTCTKVIFILPSPSRRRWQKC
jgi:hypothetical protein